MQYKIIIKELPEHIQAEAIHPDKDDVIVVRYDTKKIKPDQIPQLSDCVRNIFPDNRCVFLPDDVFLISSPLERMKQIRDMFSNYISYLEENQKNE